MEEKSAYIYTDKELKDILSETRDVLFKIYSYMSEGYSKLSNVPIIGSNPISLMNGAFQFFTNAIFLLENIISLISKVIENEYIDGIHSQMEGKNDSR